MIRALGFLLFVLVLALGLSGLHPLRPIKAMLIRSGYRASGVSDNPIPEHGGSRIGSRIWSPSRPREAEPNPAALAAPAATNGGKALPESGLALPTSKPAVSKDGNGRLVQDVFQPEIPLAPDPVRSHK